MRRSSRVSFVAFPATLVLLLACGGGEQKAADTATPAPAPPPAAAGQLTPKEGKQVVRVEMVTDDQGNNRFVPNEVTATEGDVVRFTLVQGVHNVNFVADSNKSVTTPPPSEMLRRDQSRNAQLSSNQTLGTPALTADACSRCWTA